MTPLHSDLDIALGRAAQTVFLRESGKHALPNEEIVLMFAQEYELSSSDAIYLSQFVANITSRRDA